MSVRMRAVVVGAILAMGFAPAAEAAKSRAAKHGGHNEAAKKSKLLRKEITSQRMKRHLSALQVISDENGGNRASGFQGYGASQQYILTKLRDAGYRPTVQVFDFVTFEELSDPVLRQVAPTAKEYTQAEFATMNYSASGDTDVQTITPVDIKLDGDRTPAGNGGGSGCEPADFTGFPAGNIALMQRGFCDFSVKAVNAQAAGATGAIIFNQGNLPGRTDVVAGTLGETAQDGLPDPADVTIPVVGISFDEGARLANEADPTTGQIIVDAKSDRRKSSNILADTRSGNPDNVTIVGSHLDSVPEGPGINDNGSGSAFNLELAVRIAKKHVRQEPRAVRVVGCRGVRPGRGDALRRGDHRRRVRADRGEPELRHAGLAQPRAVRLRRRLLGHDAARDGT